MKNKMRITSILVFLAIGYLLSAVSCFAVTQIPVTASIKVAPEGQYAPEITVIDQTVTEANTAEFDVLATDANTADVAHIEITQGQPPWLTVVSNTDNTPPGGTATMHLRAAPPQGAIGKYRVYFTATDNSLYSLNSTKDIYITVNPQNQAPVITVQDQNVQVGNLLTFNVNCQDADGSDTVTLTYSGKPDWLTAIPSDNPVGGNPINITFTGTPQISNEGTSTLIFNATDNGTPQQTASKQIVITVNRINHPPVLAPIRDKAVPVGLKLEFTVSATDPDGNALTYTATGLPFSNGATFDPATRKFSWTPAKTQAGSYPAHFEVSDGQATASEDITIIVNNNEPPVFDPLLDKYTKVGKTLSFAVIARDPNNDPLTYSASALPEGAIFDSSTHTFTWAPAAAGTYRDIIFSVTDNTYTVTKSIWIFVNDVNAPELNPITEKHIRPGQLLSFTISAMDPDTPQSSLIYSVSNNPPGSSLTGQTFTWVPAPAQGPTPPDTAREYRDVMFTVSDGVSSDTKGMWIFVEAGGAPVIQRIGDKSPIEGQAPLFTVVEGRTLSFGIYASDPDGDLLTYSATNLPIGAEFDTSTHTFTWIPAIGQRGVYRDIAFTVNDGLNTVNEDIWISVDANDAPVIEPLLPEYVVKPGESLSFAISAFDPNGDNLTYRVLNPPPGAVFSNRTFSWLPTPSQVGVYEDIIFEISDGVNVVTKGTWIEVMPQGAPVLSYMVNKYATVGDTVTFTISATDPDTPQSALIYSATNLPSGAAFNPLNQTFTWTPSAPGDYKDIMFTVSDGVNTDTKGIWIFVKAVGAPKLFIPAELHTKTDELLEFTAIATDSDTPQSGLTFSASNLPPGATFNPSTQVFSWTPAQDQAGTYPDIVFMVSDGVSTDTKWIWIFVTAAGTPRFNQDITEVQGRVGEPIVITVSATDPDNTPSELTYSAVNLPYGATFIDQTFRWTPGANQAGIYPDVRLEVRDPAGNVDADKFWIFVAQNSPPVLDTIGTQYGTAGQPLTFTISATDPDSADTLTFTASGLPGDAALVDNGNRTATFTWANPQAETYTGVHFEVSDGALKASENITIEIQ